jgi:regulatory protein
VALRLLGQRSHSTAELAQKLARRGCAGEGIDHALRRLRELGYLDDRGYADRLVERRAGERGRNAIAAELARKGVPRELAAEALAGLGRDDQLQAARRLTARFGPLEPRRLAARLERRGFGPEVIRAVLEGLEGDDWSTTGP